MRDVAGFIEWMEKIKNVHVADNHAMARAIENLQTQLDKEKK